MSETTSTSGRDATSGRFLAGSKGGPGRKPGSRGRLGSAFIEDLHRVWEDVGDEALRRCAAEEPGQFCRIVASLMPRDIDLSIEINASDFASRFQQARQLLGVPEQAPEPRSVRGRLLEIDHDGG